MRAIFSFGKGDVRSASNPDQLNNFREINFGILYNLSKMIQNDLKILKILGSRDGAVLKAFASHQRSPGSKEKLHYTLQTVAAHERNIEVLHLLNVRNKL